MNMQKLIPGINTSEFPSSLLPRPTLTPEQSRYLVQQDQAAGQALTTVVVGIGAIGELLAATADANELGQSTAVSLGYFLREMADLTNALLNVRATAREYGWRPLEVANSPAPQNADSKNVACKPAEVRP